MDNVIREVEIEGQRFFVFHDVCKALDLAPCDAFWVIRCRPRDEDYAEVPVQVMERKRVISEAALEIIRKGAATIRRGREVEDYFSGLNELNREFLTVEGKKGRG